LFLITGCRFVRSITSVSLSPKACTGAWNTINCLSTELFPTAVRATALGVLAAAGRLGSIAAQFVNGTLQDHVAVLLAVTAATMLAGAASALPLPNAPASGALVE
jgi:putative MFS transporter